MTLILIPDKRIMEDIIDGSLESVGVKAFDAMMDIKSITGCQIVIPSQMSVRLDKRFGQDHKAALYSHIDIDFSTKGLDGFDSLTSYEFLVPKKSINPKDLVIFVAHDINTYNIKLTHNRRLVNSSAFVEKTAYIMSFAKKFNLDFYDEIIIKLFSQ